MLRDNTHGELRALRIAASDGFMTGHQVMKVRVFPRKAPEWASVDSRVREVILRSFPRINEDTDLGYKQRLKAGVWMRFIQLYWRYRESGGCGMELRRPEPGGVYTLKDLADEMGMSIEQAKSLRVRIVRAGKGLRCDGRGGRRRGPVVQDAENIGFNAPDPVSQAA